ncbi:MAG: hypothetical protein R3F36_00075 [Candidatus Competibacteraceae bacterium]
MTSVGERSITTSFHGGTPCLSSAAVTAPVPPPSSTTSPSRSSGTREAMQLASAGALGQAAPMARGLAQISRVNNASDAAPGFCINTFTKRFIPYLVVKSREPLIDRKVACCAMATGASSRRKTPAYR